MKIEDIKIGTKVKLISTENTDEHLGHDLNEMLHVGSVSEVIDFGADIDECDYVELSDGYWYAVDDLELYEEPDNLGKLTASISLEDKEEIAKDILKIVLQDLNVVISDAIESLSDDKKEDDSHLELYGKELQEVLKPNLDFSDEKLQAMFEEVMKEYLRDSIETLNKKAFNI